MFSEGYSYWFEGMHYKRFYKTKSFKELIIAISNQPLINQQELLNTKFEK
ncbi:MAG: hypothetical protein SNJ71_03935 [Bacteroidales bacterium]